MRKIIFHKDLLSLIKKKKGRALDLGCGESNYSSVLSRNGWQVDLVDSNKKILNQKTFHNQKIFAIDLENSENRFLILKSLSKKYDLILLIKYTNRKIFKTLQQILKINGLIFIENFMVENSINNRSYKLRKFELSNSKYCMVKFYQGYHLKRKVQSAILKKRGH